MLLDVGNGDFQFLNIYDSNSDLFKIRELENVHIIKIKKIHHYFQAFTNALVINDKIMWCRRTLNFKIILLQD